LEEVQQKERAMWNFFYQY